MEICVAALRHVHHLREPERQWIRAVTALKSMTELEKVHAWQLFSSDNLKLEAPSAVIMHSQYKMLFKAAVREARPEDETECCSHNSNSVDLVELLEKYRIRLEEASFSLAAHSPHNAYHANGGESDGNGTEYGDDVPNKIQELSTTIKYSDRGGAKADGELEKEVNSLRAQVNEMWEKGTAENAELAVQIGKLSNAFVHKMEEHAVRIDKTHLMQSECILINVETHGAIGKLETKMNENTQTLQTFKKEQESQNTMLARSVLDVSSTLNPSVQANTKAIDTIHTEQAVFTKEFHEELAALKLASSPSPAAPLEARIGGLEAGMRTLSSSSAKHDSDVQILTTRVTGEINTLENSLNALSSTQGSDVETLRKDINLKLESNAALSSAITRVEKNQQTLDDRVKIIEQLPQATNMSSIEPDTLTDLNQRITNTNTSIVALTRVSTEKNDQNKIEIGNLKTKLQELEKHLETKRSDEEGGEDPERELFRIEVTKLCTAANAALREKEATLESDIVHLKQRCDQLVKIVKGTAMIKRGENGFGDLTLFELLESKKHPTNEDSHGGVDESPTSPTAKTAATIEKQTSSLPSSPAHPNAKITPSAVRQAR